MVRSPVTPGASAALSSPLGLCLCLSECTSDRFQDITGDIASLFATGHSDEAAVLVLTAHTDLEEEEEEGCDTDCSCDIRLFKIFH